MKKILFCFVILISAVTFGQQKLQNLKGSTPMKVEFLGKSPKLTDIKPIPNRTKASESDVYIVPNKFTKTGLLKHGPNSAPDPVIQKTTLSPFARGAGEVLQGFDGASNADNAAVNGVRTTPPDTQGDVGPNHYIQMINSLTTIFDKSGNILLGPVPNSVFFQDLDPRLAGTNDGDPVVLYDQFADRWIISQFATSAGAPFAMLIAVSATPDPLGAYNQYAIDYGNDFPDYPKLGIWNDALYITTRDFLNRTFQGFSIVAINRADIIAGVETEAQRFEIDNPPFDGILPADADGTMLPPEGEPHYSLFLGNGNEMNLISTTIDFENPANSTLEFGTIPVAPYLFFDGFVPQANGQSLDAIPFFLMYRLQYMNFGTHASLLANHSVQEVAGGPFGVRWYEFRDTGTEPWEVYQQGTFMPDDGLSRWMGSIAINANGDIGLAYSVSSATLAPSIRFAGQSVSESGTGILNIPETSILEGTFFSSGPQTRWGDYSMISVDPVDQDFWYTTEYIADGTGNFGWATYISEMTLGDPPPIVVRPSSISEVLSVDETIVNELELSNTTEEVINLTVSAAPTATFIEFPNGSEFSIDALSSEILGVQINTTGIQKGIYDEIITATIEGIDTPIEIPVNITVLDGTEAPIISVDPESFDEVLEQFKTVTKDLTIENSGDADLMYTITVDDSTSNRLFSNQINTTNALISENGFVKKDVIPSSGTVGISEYAESSLNYTNQLITTLYATDFEDFTLGSINNQLGWTSRFDDNWSISDANPFEGSFHLRGTSDGLGSTRPGITRADSPSIIPGDSGFTTISAELNIEGGGTTWEMVPFSTIEGNVMTIVRFRADRTIEILDAGQFVSIDTILPNGFFVSKIVFNKDDSTFTVAINNQIIYQGRGFTSSVDKVIFGSPMETAGSTIDIDNLQIIDGDPDGTFITVTPLAGVVPFGTTSAAEVKLDARDLEPGIYNASIDIMSNDSINSTIKIPVALTVLSPPLISVTPDSLSVAVDVEVDFPPVRTETITVANSGESVLDFTTSLGSTSITLPESTLRNRIDVSSLDMRDYGVGTITTNTVIKSGNVNIDAIKENLEKTVNNTTFTDSIFYDSGTGIPNDFVGIGDNVNAVSSAIRFDTDRNFTLSAVRNFYRTESLADPVIILEVYRGGDTPANGELLLSQTITEASAEGIFLLETLEESLDFVAGETFWVVHKYPAGIPFAQGIDENGTPRAGANLFSSNGGATWDTVPDNFIILCRALSGGNDNYLTLEPASASVEPGESVDVTVTFNGSSLANGSYATDILLASNDPVTPVATVATTFEVSGQVSEISISDEFLLFNNVFLGDSLEQMITIENNGLSRLNITSISSDNSDFILSDQEAVIDAGESLDLKVNFIPSSLGSINGIISIISDASNEPSLEIVVNGIGVDPPIAVFDPTEKFETIDTGETKEVTVSLRNDGNSPLIYSFPDFAARLALSKPDVQLNNTTFISFEKSAPVSERDYIDDRKGHKVEFSVGTDNEFGYTWIDSDEAGGPVYNFVDITGTGTEVTPDIGISGSVNAGLSFPFFFYGNTYSELLIHADGFVSFQETPGFTFINGQIPLEDGVNNIIAPFWDNFNPQSFDGAIHYQSFDDRFIVQWTNMTESFGGTEDATATFQLVLYIDGNIDVFYEDVESYTTPDGGTVGIENADATDGAQVAFNTDYIKNNLALRFIKPDTSFTDFITDVSKLSGVLPAGGSTSLTVTLDATDLVDGTYFDNLELSSNSPDKSNSTVMFELDVTGFPEISVAPSPIDFGELFIGVGLEKEVPITITNTGTKELEVSSILNSNENDFLVLFGAPKTIQPGASVGGSIVFFPSPTSEGLVSGEITFVSNDSFGNENLILPVSGIGLIPPVINVDPESLALTLDEGDSVTEIITISNTGGSPLNYSVSPPVLVPSDSLTNNISIRGYERMEFAPITSKEQPDTRKGPAFFNASGGPDTFGYTWVDNNSGGPDYEFIDISTSGTQASLNADGDQTVPLPFAFNFFGVNQNEVIIAANGFLTFEPITASFGAFLNQQIPSPANPNNFIAPLWDDLEPQNGTGVFYQGTEDYFIVQYEMVPSLGTLDPVTFQVILFPDGSFKMQYKNVDSDIRTSGTVGIEGPQGNTGLQVVFNSEYLTNELAITFSPPVLGTVLPGESVEVPVDFSTEGLEAGLSYTGNITIGSNDPITSELLVPVTLEVLELPEVLNLSLVNAVTDEVVGVIQDGDTIDINDFGSNDFNIIANVNEVAIGSVIFDYNFQNRFKVRNRAPFTLAGEKDGNFKSIEFPLGNNTLTATPYKEKRGKGKVGVPLTIGFTVVDSSLPEIVSFTLVDADTDQTIGEIADGDVIDLTEFASNSFNIIANRGIQRAGSIIFDFNGISRYRRQNDAPYALGGRNGLDFNSLSFPLGRNVVTATPYTGRNGRGDEGSSLTITFEVVDGSGEIFALSNDTSVDGTSINEVGDADFIVNNPVYDFANFTIQNRDSKDLTLTLMNMTGQIILSPEDISIDAFGKGSIDMSNISNGMYVLIVMDSKETVISQKKLIKR